MSKNYIERYNSTEQATFTNKLRQKRREQRGITPLCWRTL
uniref:Uncharacterized protein n=1 Tax=Arundo donax TaxID=35708 RepID=A0A0A9I7Y4_ARUDO